MAKDFYKTLELSKGADDKQVKAAYRRLARKYHPDVNPNDKQAEARFKEVTEAYEVLSDPEKRKLYDQFGSNWEAVRQGQTHFQGEGSPFDFQFEGDLGSIFEQFMGASRSGRPRGVEPHDVEQVVDVSLEEIDSGTKRVLTYQVPDACKSCDGTGYVPLRNARPCPSCGGSGVTKGLFGMGQPCGMCGGTGSSSLESCPSCRGEGSLLATRRVEVKIPVGVTDGKKLRVPGRGSTGANGRSGDLYVLIRETPHPNFKRRGEDLETEVSVPFPKAILGGEVRVSTLTGQVSMKIPECSQPGQTFRLAGKGIMNMKGQRGNLLAKIKVLLPRTLDNEQRKLLAQLEQMEKHTV